MTSGLPVSAARMRLYKLLLNIGLWRFIGAGWSSEPPATVLRLWLPDLWKSDLGTEPQ